MNQNIAAGHGLGSFRVLEPMAAPENGTKITLEAFRQAAPGRWWLPVRCVLRRLHPVLDVSPRAQDTVGSDGMKIRIPISLGLVFFRGREGEL